MLPRIIHPMLAQSAGEPFDSEQHLFEIKWDGIRCLAFVEGGQVRLQSRQVTEITPQFPELGCLARLPSGTIVDGELVAMQDGKPSLHQIQQRAFLQNAQRIRVVSELTPVTYMVFDLLNLKGRSLLATPFSIRRDALRHLIEQTPMPGVVVPMAVCNSGCRLFGKAVRLGLEGIMAKRLDSPYLPGKRSRLWLKIKPRLSAEVLGRPGRLRYEN
jgi:ATP-dependent DNA ligase